MTPDAPICPYCHEAAKLVDSAIVYGRSFGPIWDCRPCDAYVGVHANSPTHKAKGSLANRELREWRKRAHAAFDRLWQSGQMTRPAAYLLLQEKMGMNSREGHIGKFTIEQCRKVVELFEEQGES